MYFTSLIGTILVLTIIPKTVIGIGNGDCPVETCQIRTAIARGAIALVKKIVEDDTEDFGLKKRMQNDLALSGRVVY